MPRSGWSHSALPNAPPAAFLTTPHYCTHTTVSWRYFICNLITILIALNGIMMGNRRLAFEGSIAAVQFKCSHRVMANSLCGRGGRGLNILCLQSTYHLLLNDRDIHGTKRRAPRDRDSSCRLSLCPKKKT